MTRYDFEIVPQVALDSRYNDLVQIFTFRTNDRTVANALFTKLARDLSDNPNGRYVFWLFDFASRNQPVTSYIKQRLQKLAETTALPSAHGRIAVTTARSLNNLLSADGVLRGLESALPTIELRGFFNRDDAIAWLIAGYERATLRAK